MKKTTRILAVLLSLVCLFSLVPITALATNVSVNSLTANRTTGTTNDTFNFTATTNIAADRVELRFNGNNTVFRMNSNSNGRTWTLNGNSLAAGNRTVTVTAFVGGRSATRTLNVTVTQPQTNIAVNSLTANRTAGTTNDTFNFTAATNTVADRVELRFNGNSTVFRMQSSNNGRTWTLSGNTLAAGNRTVTVTAFAGGRSATRTLNVTVTQPQVNNTVRFPLRGQMVHSSTARTNGFFCDFRAPMNTRVYAPANGTVSFRQTFNTIGGTRTLTSFGNSIIFTSACGQYRMVLAHLNSFNGVTLQIPSNRTAQQSSNSGTSTITLATRQVRQGDFIGLTGTTGNSDGPHLHFELYRNGSAVNPVSVLRTW